MAQEKNFEEKVKKFLKEQGCWFLKYWAGAAYTKSGIPDLLICCNGYFLGVELKAPNGKPSDLQLYNLRQIGKSGGFGILLYPKDFEQFKKFIEQLNQFDNSDICEKFEEFKMIFGNEFKRNITLETFKRLAEFYKSKNDVTQFYGVYPFLTEWNYINNQSKGD